jgi:uncharacterized protein YbbC (DUF1343 family)/CubicO group peptidase (beta-lactamase class C family)
MIARILFALGMLAALANGGAFHETKLREIDAAIRLAIADGRLPGGVLWLERNGTIYEKAYGNRAVVPEEQANTEGTIYDVASLTKVLATAPAIMRLAEQGRVDLDAPVSRYVPAFTGKGKERVTVRSLLTHTSGARPGISTSGWSGYESGILKAAELALGDEPGSRIRYSDVNFILLGEIVRAASGEMLDAFCAREIFGPLKMTGTMFNPPPALADRIAPTTTGVERGVVHDPTARAMGGIAGHAGLFSTASDVAKFSRMLLEGGPVLKRETIEAMTRVSTPPEIEGRRGLGWDIDTPFSGPRGRWLPLGSFGHTGWTGGSMWVDPFSKTSIIFLSNRNHPTESGSVLPLRMLIGTLAAEAVRDFNFIHVPGALTPTAETIRHSPHDAPAASVLNGIDVLAEDGFAALRGLRVGLITNHTGIDRNRKRTVDVLAKAEGVKLVALFSPEHGIAGKLDEKVGDDEDAATGLPVFSLYGEGRAPKAEQLANIDALVFDIQDIGCRFYTYISTMGECMTVAGKMGKKFVVLDRPNPIGGTTIEGPMLDGERSFTAWHDIPLRHGMTVGELAKLFNSERNLGVELTVVPCKGWRRDMWFDQTQQPWVNPSPNMRSLNAAALYPGVGLVEFCNISVGRGTDRPFEIIGAPYVDDRRLALELGAAGLVGVTFTPTRFTPTASMFSGKECGGVMITITDRRSLNAVDIGIEVARAFQRLYPKEWQSAKFAKLLVHPATQTGVMNGEPLSKIRESWVSAREEFLKRRQRVLIYE